MKTSLFRILVAAATLFAANTALNAQAPADITKKKFKEPLVEFGMMTWPEVREAFKAGKTTALVYTGGTEQRGPQNVNGGHTLMGQAIAKAIALKLGNALFLPVLPYTPNGASATLPGTIGLTPELLSAILERVSEEAIKTGFKNVVLMGDHGGGQPTTYVEVAKKLEDKYGSQGIHVFYCDRVYAPAQDDFGKMVVAKGLPENSHAGLPDTAEMLYLGNGAWSREDLIPTALGDPVVPRGTPRDPNAVRKNNGITGDARGATRAWGKIQFDMKIDYAVKQIQGFIPPASK